MTAEHTKPAIPHLAARLPKHPLETHISDTSNHFKISRSPSIRSIPQAPTRGAYSGSLDARFHEHKLETHVRQQNTSAEPAILPLGARFHVEPSDRSQIEVTVRRAFPEGGRSLMRINALRHEIKRPLVVGLWPAYVKRSSSL